MKLVILEISNINEEILESMEIVERIEKKIIEVRETSKTNKENIFRFLKKMNQHIRMNNIHLKDISMVLYIVPCSIIGYNKNTYCDGFVYIAKTPVIVLKQNTDMISVLGHEICHVILREILPESMNFADATLEMAVEFLECILCQDKIHEQVLPHTNLIIEMVNKYMSMQSSPDIFLRKELL